MILPKCKICPILKACNKNAVVVQRPVKWDKDGKASKFIPERLCALEVALARIQPRKETIKVKVLKGEG